MALRSLISLIALLLILTINDLIGQTKIYGTITGAGEGIPSVSVTLKDSLSTSILAYAYSNNLGYYELTFKGKGEYILVFSSLGFEQQSISLNLSADQREILMDVSLTEQALDLDEIVINADRPVIVVEDTINYRTKFFADGTEQTVEELLSKIPGVRIEGDGTIKVGNQEIEKLMIDGDDFFDKGYKILSKNMPAYPIEEVEILNHYSNNRLLKGIEDSEKVALNLKLNEDSKRIWFGNISGGYSLDEFFELKGSLMNFGKTNKYFFIKNFNTIGYDATSDVEDLIRPAGSNEPSGTGDDQQVATLINLSPDNLNFARERVNFNNAGMISLNTIFNPTDKLKIRALGFLNRDSKDFFRDRTDRVDVSGASFINTEEYQLRNRVQLAFGKIDLTYNISKNEMLDVATKYNYGDFDDHSELLFNGNKTGENLAGQNNLYDQKITYSRKITDKKVLLLTGRFINESAPQSYQVNRFFYRDLFPETDSVDHVSQLSKASMQFGGFNAHWLDRLAKGHLLELQAGNEFRSDQLDSELSIYDNEGKEINPVGYSNNTGYQTNNAYFKGRYRYEVKELGITSVMNIHHLSNQLENGESDIAQNRFVVNPGIGFDWRINENNKLVSSYAFNTTNAMVGDVYDGYVLTSFRGFEKGTGTLNQLDASGMVINYQFGNWGRGLFVNTFVIYNKNHDFFSTNTLIRPNYTQSDKILIKDREYLSVNTRMEHYLNLISANLKLDLGFRESEYKNVVNDSEFRKVSSVAYRYAVELRSGFTGIFNYHMGTKWNAYSIVTSIRNRFTDNVTFLDLSLLFNEEFDLQLQSERYYFGNLQRDNEYYFLDIEARYKLMDGRLTLGISGKNLLNTKRFRNFGISDVGTTTTQYRLLPRFILLKAEYRF